MPRPESSETPTPAKPAPAPSPEDCFDGLCDCVGKCLRRSAPPADASGDRAAELAEELTEREDEIFALRAALTAIAEFKTEYPPMGFEKVQAIARAALFPETKTDAR